MTIRKLTLVLVAIALITGMFAVNTAVVAQKQVQWEYMVQGKRELDRKEGEGMGSEFNNLGAQGWEFVGVLPGKADAYSVVFKRKK